MRANWCNSQGVGALVHIACTTSTPEACFRRGGHNHIRCVRSGSGVADSLELLAWTNSRHHGHGRLPSDGFGFFCNREPVSLLCSIQPCASAARCKQFELRSIPCSHRLTPDGQRRPWLRRLEHSKGASAGTACLSGHTRAVTLLDLASCPPVLVPCSPAGSLHQRRSARNTRSAAPLTPASPVALWRRREAAWRRRRRAHRRAWPAPHACAAAPTRPA